MLRLGYGQLPDLTYWWVDAYIDVSEAQTPRLRRELDDFLRWHRQAELPHFIRVLQQLQAMAPQPISADQACAVFEALRERYHISRDRLEPPALWLAQTLSTEQLAHMARKYAKNNSDWRDDWQNATPEQQLKRRLKSPLDRAEHFYGNLEDSQLQALRADLSASSYNAQTQWTERQRRQHDVLQTLKSLSTTPLPPAQARASLHALLERMTQSPDPRYRSYSAALVRQNCAIFSRLHNSTSPAQRSRAVVALKRYEDDLRSLMSP